MDAWERGPGEWKGRGERQNRGYRDKKGRKSFLKENRVRTTSVPKIANSKIAIQLTIGSNIWFLASTPSFPFFGSSWEREEKDYQGERGKRGTRAWEVKRRTKNMGIVPFYKPALDYIIFYFEFRSH